MKKLLFVFAAMLTVVLVGCKKGAQDAEPEEIKLSVDPSSINSPAFGADYLLTLTAPDAWTAECADSWVKVNPTSGNAGTVEISVKISANKESAESNSKIVFKSGDKTLEVPVKRAAKDPARLKVSSETDIKTPKDGGSYAVMVESNIKWQISSSASWAKIQGEAIKRNNATITVIVDPATAPEETTATLTVKPYGEGTEAGEQTVTITRSASDATSMSVDKSEINATSEGGNFTIQVTSTAKWKATASWDAEWLSIENAEGDGNGSFSIKVKPATSTNDASTIVTVTEVRTDYYEPVQLQVLVNRAGKATASLSVSPQKIDAPIEGGEYAISIKSNYAWTATTYGASFFSTSIKKGEAGESTMIVTVKPDDTGKEENGHITIKTSFGGEEAIVNIRREATKLIVSTNQITMDCEGGYEHIYIESNTSWKIKSGNDNVVTPLGIEPSEGTGNKKVSIFVRPAQLDNTVDWCDLSVQTTASKQIVQYINVQRKAIPGSFDHAYKPFSVSETQKVFISRGNLMYHPVKKAWSITTQQFFFVGNKVKGNVYDDNYKKCSNTEISDTYDGWIDLFGWGTGDNPTLRTVDDDKYSTFVDWEKNDINNEYTYDWRTMSAAEWKYMVNGRPNASSLRGKANIYNVDGWILLPDEWTPIADVDFTPNASDYSANKLSMADWKKMEKAGAIFLPNAGIRDGLEVSFETTGYWTKTHLTDATAVSGGFRDEFLFLDQRHFGRSVRLVANIESAE